MKQVERIEISMKYLEHQKHRHAHEDSANNAGAV
jgi:hypothetical protein